MSDRKELIIIGYHTDDDTGMNEIGEVDFGVSPSELEDFIRKYGADDLLQTLNTLIHKVIDVKLDIAQENQCSNSKFTPN